MIQIDNPARTRMENGGLALGVGVPLGLLAGYAGGWIDSVLSRIVDAMLAVPFLILAIALAAFLGPSLTNAMIAIGVTATPIFVRLTRGQTLAAKVEDYVEAARAGSVVVGAVFDGSPLMVARGGVHKGQ